jgi:heptosyltransferase-1
MERILVVKVTSLGDVIHAQPVVADLHRHFPGVKIDWAADASCADVLYWNRGIDRVLCAPLRGFKKHPSKAALASIVGSVRALRAVRYDAVIDIHGVYKSAIISFLSRSRERYGYRAEDLGERGAAFAYTKRIARSMEYNAWNGMRVSVGEAFGYTIDSPPEFGIEIPKAAAPVDVARKGPFAMLFHATSNEDKKWPCEHWRRLAHWLSDRGLRVALPWGSLREREEAVAIANGIPGAIVLPRLSVLEIAQHIDQAALVVGTDTGLCHLACAVGVPTVMIFTATSPRHCGIDVPGQGVSVGDDGAPPAPTDVERAIESVYAPLNRRRYDVAEVRAVTAVTAVPAVTPR